MRKISKDERQTIDLFLKRVDEAANHFRHIGDDDMADNLYFGAGMVRNLFKKQTTSEKEEPISIKVGGENKYGKY